MLFKGAEVYNYLFDDGVASYNNGCLIDENNLKHNCIIKKINKNLVTTIEHKRSIAI
jgi:hypothetical protein